MIETFFVWDHDYLKISRWPSGMINSLVWSSVFYSSFLSEFWRHFSIILRSLLLLVFTHFHKICLSLEAHRIFVPDIFWYFTVIYCTLVWVCFHPLVLALWNFLNLGRGPFSPFYFFGIIVYLLLCWASLVAQLVKNLPATWETWVQSLGWEGHLEKGKATHSSIVAWRIPWTV